MRLLRAVAILSVLLAACGHPEPGQSPAGLYKGVQCLSADEEGLISCHEAIDHAASEAGSAADWNATKADARVDMWRRNPGSEPIRIWAITYHAVDIPLSGRPDVEPVCIVGDWGIAIDATTGAYLVEGTSGDQEPVPCSTRTD